MLPRPVLLWLSICLVMVFTMILIGAITRLTDSGLSMVEWRPIYGFLPPLSEAEWNRIFALYKTIPEYQYQNFGMDLAGFKSIFWWEYFHRVWGRLIGILYSVPLAVFWLRGMLPMRWKFPLFLLLLLGAAQGGIGWWMVKSGLKDNLDVSAFRLMMHLGIALIIMVLLRTCILLGKMPYVSRETSQNPRWQTLLLSTWLLSFLTILSGALVAGNDAGLVYNDWPLMNGRFVPAEYDLMAWVTDQATVQFHHRMLAYLLTLMIVLLVVYRGQARTRKGQRLVWLVAAFVILQVCLGIFTVMTVAHVHLAIVHHANALLLLLMITQLVFHERWDKTAIS